MIETLRWKSYYLKKLLFFVSFWDIIIIFYNINQNIFKFLFIFQRFAKSIIKKWARNWKMWIEDNFKLWFLIWQKKIINDVSKPNKKWYEQPHRDHLTGLENTLHKLHRTNEHHKFTKKCHQHGILPNFTKLNPHMIEFLCDHPENLFLNVDQTKNLAYVRMEDYLTKLN